MKLINLSLFALLILMLSCNAEPDAQESSDQKQDLTEQEVVTTQPKEKRRQDNNETKKEKQIEKATPFKEELKAVESTAEMLANVTAEFNLSKEEQAKVAKMLKGYDYGSHDSNAQKDIRMKIKYTIRDDIKAPK